LSEKDRFIVSCSDLKSAGFRGLESDSRLILPFGEVVRSVVSSNDVLHALALPCLGLKVDAVPGRLNQLIYGTPVPGVYFGQCSELCGVNHRFMPIVLEFTGFKNFDKQV